MLVRLGVGIQGVCLSGRLYLLYLPSLTFRANGFFVLVRLRLRRDILLVNKFFTQDGFGNKALEWEMGNMKVMNSLLYLYQIRE